MHHAKMMMTYNYPLHLPVSTALVIHWSPAKASFSSSAGLFTLSGGYAFHAD